MPDELDEILKGRADILRWTIEPLTDIQHWDQVHIELTAALRSVAEEAARRCERAIERLSDDDDETDGRDVWDVLDVARERVRALIPTAFVKGDEHA